MAAKYFNPEQVNKLKQLINEGMGVMQEVETLNGGLADTVKAIAEELRDQAFYSKESDQDCSQKQTN